MVEQRNCRDGMAPDTACTVLGLPVKCAQATLDCTVRLPEPVQLCKTPCHSEMRWWLLPHPGASSGGGEGQGMDAVLDAEGHAFEDRARLALLQPAQTCMLSVCC